MVPPRARVVCRLLFCVSSSAVAGEADITAATGSCDADGLCSFTVSVRHADAGWEHYADHWRILTTDGRELGRRVLLHPHDDEQPFTRSLSGVNIPAHTKQVVIEAHDSVDGYGGGKLTINLDAVQE